MYCTSLGCDLPARGCTARGWGATEGGAGVLHEGPGLVQYAPPLTSSAPPSCSSRPEETSAGSGPLIERHQEPSGHHQKPEEGPEVGSGVQIGDKGSDRSHPGGAKPHDSKVLVHAAWGLEALCHRSGHHRADSSEESGAADLPGRPDQHAEVAVRTRPAWTPSGAGGRGGSYSSFQSRGLTGLRSASTPAVEPSLSQVSCPRTG